MTNDLNIPEQFLLMAHHPEKGRFVRPGRAGDYMKYGIAGAILLDLYLAGAIRMEQKVIRYTGNTGKTYPEAEEALARISGARKDRKAKYWVRKLGGRGSRYRKTLCRELQDKGLLQIENKKFLGLIPYQKSYLTQSMHRSQMLTHLRQVLLQQKKAQKEDAVLLGLIRACHIHSILAGKKGEGRKIRKALKQFMKDNAIAGAVDQTLQEIQAAVFASISAAAVASAATSSGG